MRLAFESAGAECVFSPDWDKFAQQTYEANFGHSPAGNIREIPASDIPDHDILLAGFLASHSQYPACRRRKVWGASKGRRAPSEGVIPSAIFPNWCHKLLMNNVRFNYLYRDASNYLRRESVVFADSDQGGFHQAELENRLRRSLMVDGTFSTHQIRLPELFLYAAGAASSDDHCLHEFFGLEGTTDQPDDHLERSFSQFLNEIQEASRGGWSGFDRPRLRVGQEILQVLDLVLLLFVENQAQANNDT